MRSFTCHHCGYVSWAVEGGACKSCGAQQGAAPPPGQGWSGHYVYGSGATRRRGMAVASLVLGLLSLPTLGLLLVGSLLGIILGIVALKNANQNPAEYGGKGLAIGGIVTSATAVLLAPVIGIIAAIAIPNLLAARRAANEGSAISSIRTITGAEVTYRASAGRYGDLRQLAAQSLIDEQTGRGLKNGYVLQVFSYGDEFDIAATPLKYGSSGTRSFFYSSRDEVLRAEDRHGRPADGDSPPLGQRNLSGPPFGAAPAPPGAYSASPAGQQFSPQY
jgi:type II secretory pathway pseudopilin PulG